MKKTMLALAVILIASCSGEDEAIENKSGQRVTTQSENLDAGLVVSWGRQKDFFVREDFEIIEWEEAKNKLLEGKYRGGKQYHTGWLTIYSLDDSKYLTKQPKLDALWEFMEANGLSTAGFGTE